MRSSRRQIAFRAACLALLAAAPGTVTVSQAAVTISTAQTSNMSCSGGVCAPTATDAVLNVNDLETMLASGNVRVTTTGSGVQASNIIVANSFSWSSANAATLDAYHSIAIDSPVSIKGVSGLDLTTNDGGSGGTLWFGSSGHVAFAHLSSTLTINSAAYTLVKTLPKLASAIAHDPSGSFALSSGYNAKRDGTYSAAPIATTFTGSFNGLGNAISHLKIHATAKNTNLGLFAQVSASGTVSSTRVTTAEIRGTQGSYAGLLAGLSYGNLFNVYVSGGLKAPAGDGGLVGGLVGGNVGSILSAAATAVVSVGARKAITQVSAGGLVGASSGTIEQSYAVGAVTVIGTEAQSTAGALVGFSSGPVENCYATGAASAPGNSMVGGLVGEAASTVASAYSTGAPSGGTGSYVGGFLGYDETNGGVSNTYWDTTTSGITNLSQGAGNIPNDPGITGETTAQLQAGLPAGFDPTIWAENPSINGGLPYLIANPPQ